MPVVLAFDPRRPDALRAYLREGNFHFEDRPHALFLAKREGVTLTAYKSGKLVLTGPQADEYARVLAMKKLAESEAPKLQPAPFSAHAGSDESGKGDYFGPLSVACVFVTDPQPLRDAGVRDSKQIAPNEIGPLASIIRNSCEHETLVLMPPKYNELYERIQNLNHLLAWAHASVIEKMLERVGTTRVIVDQFSPTALRPRLKELGRAADIVEMVRGENDIAVAAASVLARAEFVAGIARLETQHGVKLPLGAGSPVVAAGKRIVADRGAAFLPQVAKVHFATTRQVS